MEDFFTCSVGSGVLMAVLFNTGSLIQFLRAEESDGALRFLNSIEKQSANSFLTKNSYIHCTNMSSGLNSGERLDQQKLPSAALANDQKARLPEG